MNQDGKVYTAVQEDATSFCMDWPVVQGDGGQRDGSKTQGEIFVLDCGGVRVGDTPLTASSDDAADQALHGIGWVRCGAWQRDGFGRKSAKVMAVGHDSNPEENRQHVRAGRLDSLVDETVLHLS
jgi:hypothetical protein